MMLIWLGMAIVILGGIVAAIPRHPNMLEHDPELDGAAGGCRPIRAYGGGPTGATRSPRHTLRSPPTSITSWSAGSPRDAGNCVSTPYTVEVTIREPDDLVEPRSPFCRRRGVAGRGADSAGRRRTRGHGAPSIDATADRPVSGQRVLLLAYKGETPLSSTAEVTDPATGDLVRCSAIERHGLSSS